MFRLHPTTMLLVATIVVALTASFAAAQTVVYVDHDAPGANDGSSWTDAYCDLQDALAQASTNGTIQEIRVAAGTYTPDRGTGDRTATFQLLSSVALVGAYAGYGEPDPDARDMAAYETILSGEIPGPNSYHVVTGSGTAPTAVLDGFTVIGGYAQVPSTASYNGGGIYNVGGSPTVRSCTFLGNLADRYGGAMYNENAHPSVESCVFSGNEAEYGGGAVYNYHSRPTFTNCTFSRNEAEDGGGGALWDEYSSSTLANCTFWGNTTDSSYSLEERQILSRNGTPDVNYCCIEGWSGLWGGTGNFGDDPLFIDADGADGNPGTLDDDLHLAPGSPCINTGSNDATDLPDYDVEGEVRVQHCRVDIGADETDYYTDCNANTIADACDLTAGTSDDCNANHTPDECEPDDDCNTNGIQDICELAGHDWNHNGILDGCDIAAGTSTDLDGDAIPDDAVRYVDADAPGADDGSSWENAYTDLQAALADACTNEFVSQLRVAAGIYKPTTSNDREARFELGNGLAVLGGYAGYGEPDPDARDVKCYETILSGDLLGNDAGTNGREDNSFNVVSNVDYGGPPYGLHYEYAPLDSSATLDGFTVTAGSFYSNDSYCLFTYGRFGGGGVYLGYASPTIRNCTFRDNSAEWDGGGLCTYYGHPTLINCTFEDNFAGHDGGGLCNHEGNVTLVNCVFTGNTADNDGGALYSNEYWDQAAITLHGCVFVDNTADPDYGFGGGVRSRGDATLCNCIFGRNVAFGGSGFYNSWGSAEVTNCTFLANQAVDDGAGAFSFGLDGSTNLTNCILWNNESVWSADYEDAQVAAWSGLLAVDWSCLQGLDDFSTNGVGNIGDRPMFVDSNGLDGVPGTADDNLRLLPGSPCIDAANNAAVPPDVADVDSDGDTAERTPLDLDGSPRFLDDPQTPDTGVPDPPDYLKVIDMGAYEFFPDCNTNGIPDAEELGEPLGPGPSSIALAPNLPVSAFGAVSFDGARSPHPCTRRENDRNGNCILDACE